MSEKYAREIIYKIGGWQTLHIKCGHEIKKLHHCRIICNFKLCLIKALFTLRRKIIKPNNLYFEFFLISFTPKEKNRYRFLFVDKPIYLYV